jgi:hypothetical protein
MVEVALAGGHPPDAEIVFVMVYVPGALAIKFTSPVLVLMLNPAGAAVNVPAEPPPLNVGEGFVPL